MAGFHDTWYEQLKPVLRFLNTAGHDGTTDALAELGSCRFWLIDRGFPHPRATPAEHRQLLRLRDVLRGAAAVNRDHRDPSAAVIAGLDRAVVWSRASVQFGGLIGWGLGSPPGARGYAAGLLEQITLAMARETWPQVKVCAGPGCLTAYLDTSRAGNRTWCSMATCGNRVKQARWREQHEAAG